MDADLLPAPHPRIQGVRHSNISPMPERDIPAIVFDVGSGLTKVGFSGDDNPRAIFPTVVGHPIVGRGGQISDPDYARILLIGDEAICKRGICKLKMPIEYGMCTNFDRLSSLWHHCFYNEVRVTPEEHPVMLIEAPLNPNSNREKMVEMMFERFSTPGLCLGNAEALSLMASGRLTGLVLGSGAGVTHSVAVYEGHVIQHSVRRLPLAGRSILTYLEKIMCEVGYTMTGTSEKDVIRDLKEKLCFVSLNYEDDLKRVREFRGNLECELNTQYELPDGHLMTVGEIRFRAPEILFSPSLRGENDWLGVGVHEMIDASICDCETDLWREMERNIVLSGGSTMFFGFPERVTRELQNLGRVGVNVVAPAERKYSPWIGGSILASLESMRLFNWWILKEDYDEFGASIVHRWCN